MRGFEKEIYFYWFVAANVFAIITFLTAIKFPRIARILFVILFGWAAWINWQTAHESTDVYLEYAELTWSRVYRDFITGWFASHITLAVSAIAISQATIAASMFLRGWVFRIGASGAIVFLLAIIPFGVGSGFPCTAILAGSMIILLRKKINRFIWQKQMIAIV